MTGSTQEIGGWAEALGAAFLAEKGYVLRERGYRPSGVSGEIDLIVEQGDLLVFVEVRFRRSPELIAPFETVGGVKQRRIALAALEYVTRYRLSNRPIRFDVLSMSDGTSGSRIEHVEDAFDAGVLGDRFAPYL